MAVDVLVQVIKACLTAAWLGSNQVSHLVASSSAAAAAAVAAVGSVVCCCCPVVLLWVGRHVVLLVVFFELVRSGQCAGLVTGPQKYRDTCLIDAFRAPRFKVKYQGQGPFFAVRDGSTML